MGKGLIPALAIVMQMAMASSCYAAQKAERFIIGHDGVALELILKNNKTRIVCGPDAELIIVAVGPKQLVTYRPDNRTYILYSPKDAVLFGKYNRQSLRPIKWQSWTPAGSDTICDTAVKKWIRHGVPEDRRFGRTKVTEEVWAVTKLPLTADMQIQMAALLDCTPPAGIALRDILTIEEPGLKPKVIVKAKAVKHDFVAVKDSDFVLPAGMKKVNDWWAVLAPSGAHESLFQMKE